MAILAAILKRRTTTNGFWSRENEMFNKKETTSSKICNFLGLNEQNEVESTIYSNLELKQCHLNKEVNCLLFNSGTSDRLITDVTEYSNTNSLFGTIDRLIKNQNGTGICSSSSESSTSSSSTPTNNLSQTTFCSSSQNLSAKTAKITIGSASASFIVNQQDESFEKSEIHF